MTISTAREPASSPPPVARRRVFFALWPDASARAELVALAQRVARDAQGRAAAEQRLHLTMAFVGESTDREVLRLCEIGERVACAATPFTIVLDRVGSFRDGGVAWLGATKAPTELQDMAGHLRQELAAAGFHVDRRDYRAHLTLARHCRRPTHVAEVPRVAWQATALTLTSSELSSQGPRYATVATWKLG